MKSESMLATEKMLDVVKTLLDEQQPESLFPKILEVARSVLHADAAVLEIGGEEPLHISCPDSVAISIKIVTGQSLGGDTVDPGVYTGYYANASNLKGSALESALTKIISDSHKKILTYEDLKWALQQTDEDPNNSSNLILFYCNASISKDWGGGNNWNREHVWPNSKGVGKTGPGADCHHLRPADPKVNSTRSNYKMGEVSNGTQIMYNGKGTGCYIGSSTFEPADRIKGDVARIYLYLLVRYPSLYSNLSSVANIETLIKWNALDPVDNMEVRRNNAAAVIQGNRNPFIDHPEFVNLIWKNK